MKKIVRSQCMKKSFSSLKFLLSAGALVLAAQAAFATPNAAPTGLTAQNRGGPILLTWTDASNNETGFIVYRATFATTVANMSAAGFTAANVATLLDTTAAEGDNCYNVVAYNNGNEQTAASGPFCTISAELPATGVLSVTPDNLIDTDTESVDITYTLNSVTAEKITLNIVDAKTGASVFDSAIEASNASSISTTWDGQWAKASEYGNKHNGAYFIDITVQPYVGDVVTARVGAVGVDVVHLNGAPGGDSIFLKNTEWGTNPPGQGPPFQVTYRVTRPSYVITRVINKNSGATVKTIVHDTPRQGEFASRDKSNTELWDGLDDSGQLVSNDVYYFELQAGEYVTTNSARDFLLGTDTSTIVTGEFAFDVIRMLDISATSITASAATAAINFTLTNAATVQIKIAEPGTTFTIVNGALVPNIAANVLRTMSQGFQAGVQSLTWNGQDETGAAVPNNIYTVAIAAFNNGVIALDNTGHNRPVMTQVTVDRTAVQTGSSDTTAPTLSGVRVQGIAINITGAAGSETTISPTGGFTTIVVSMADNTGGTGVSDPTITLLDPSSTIVPIVSSGTVTSGTAGTITLTYATQASTSTTPGYTVQVTPRDGAGNTGATQTINFFYATTGGATATTPANASFADTVYAYPNPATAGSATIAYTLTSVSDVKIEMFNMLGEKVYDRTLLSQPAASGTTGWNLDNKSGDKIGSGLYLIRVTATDASGVTSKATKKLVVVR